MKNSEALSVLQSLQLEFERKGEEIWSRGLEYGYESATNGYEKAAQALKKAVDVFTELEDGDTA